MEPKIAISYIRFSKAEQKKGDSLRRQMESTEQYCKQHGLTLDTSLNLQDLGKSAYHAVHMKKGALGTFLKLVEDGKVPPGRVLIVENLDRLSRQKPTEALTQFLSIINNGIKVVTLQDGQEYTTDKINENTSQLFLSIAEMTRAHKESERKAYLMNMAWEKKHRDAANGIPIPRLLPMWLKKSNDNKRYVLIPEVARAIEQIFRMKLAGTGSGQIARSINDDPTMWKPPISKNNRKGGWRQCTVDYLLRNEALIGTYQPFKSNGGNELEPAGDPIKDYFPRAIPEDLFYQVKRQREENVNRRGQGGGRKGRARNLFQHLLVCGECGDGMAISGNFSSKGRPYFYLYCNTGRERVTNDQGKQVCSSHQGIPYAEVERLIFENLEELDIERIWPNGADETAQEKIEKQILTAREKVNDTKRRISNLMDTAEVTEDQEIRRDIMTRIENLKSDQRTQQEDVQNAEQRLNELLRDHKTREHEVNNALEIYKRLDKITDEDERIQVRLKLRNLLRQLIQRVVIYPIRGEYKYQEEIEPGVVKTMHSRSIDRIVIHFKGVKQIRMLLQTRYGELDQ